MDTLSTQAAIVSELLKSLPPDNIANDNITTHFWRLYSTATCLNVTGNSFDTCGLCPLFVSNECILNPQHPSYDSFVTTYFVEYLI